MNALAINIAKQIGIVAAGVLTALIVKDIAHNIAESVAKEVKKQKAAQATSAA